tara:strand:- start:1651 stop:1767 length:117 start_codon:yes stop_codon:yes gene_type:complete
VPTDLTIDFAHQFRLPLRASMDQQAKESGLTADIAARL